MLNRPVSVLILLLILVSLVGCFPVCTTTPSNSNRETLQSANFSNWNQWVEKYDKGRRSDSGWLSLAGLFWLQSGTNSLGSLSNNLHIFPNGSPPEIGVITVNGDDIDFTVKSDQVKINGKITEQAKLIPNETQVLFGSYSFYIIKREKGYAIRLKNKLNQSIAHFRGTLFYPYNPKLRVIAKLIPATKDKTISIATVYNTVRNNDSAGLLEFTWQGKIYQLEAVSYGKDEPMALMFVDETSQQTTYGAGRFLDVNWPKQGDTTVIDFNYAYNPPCAITAFATCPLPPRQNHLDFKVEAGETFTGH
ncbi:MAG: DUF1684 domain-containing protein [Enterobacterales bacterium]|nr:DUF1684 domain-containing protein [Enterobacterales bacterium]